ncbi:MAG: PqqD family protein [Pyrinomonadaceae bacterium]|nr:PqqD family protein [Pyrinomonadaceae bacterium]
MRPVARQTDLVIKKSNDETIVYDLNTNHALYLNEISGVIWKLCDGQRNVDDIRQVLNVDFGKRVSSDFILFAIYQLRKDNLLSGSDDIDNYLKKYWGRRTIKKFGFGIMHALAQPKIKTVTAPTAIVASC